MTNQPRSFLVTGAPGFIRRALLTDLAAAGHPQVRAAMGLPRTPSVNRLRPTNRRLWPLLACPEKMVRPSRSCAFELARTRWSLPLGLQDRTPASPRSMIYLDVVGWCGAAKHEQLAVYETTA